jgi:hypothetical protein
MSSVSRWRDSGPWNVPSRPPAASRPSTPPSPRCWRTPAAASRRDAQAARHDPGTAGRPELYLFRSLVNAVPGHVRSTFARQSGPSRTFEHLILAIRHELRAVLDARNGSTQHVRQKRQLRNVLAASASSGPSIQL